MRQRFLRWAPRNCPLKKKASHWVSSARRAAAFGKPCTTEQRGRGLGGSPCGPQCRPPPGIQGGHQLTQNLPTSGEGLNRSPPTPGGNKMARKQQHAGHPSPGGRRREGVGGGRDTGTLRPEWRPSGERRTASAALAGAASLGASCPAGGKPRGAASRGRSSVRPGEPAVRPPAPAALPPLGARSRATAAAVHTTLCTRAFRTALSAVAPCGRRPRVLRVARP